MAFRSRQPVVGQNTLSIRVRKNIPVYRISETPYLARILVRHKGRFAIVTGRGQGGGGRDCVVRAGELQGGKPREQLQVRDDTALTASSVVLDGERTPVIGEGAGDVRGRQNRVVLTPERLASSLAVMLRPNRVRTSFIRKATGAIVHRSPRRARHKL